MTQMGFLLLMLETLVPLVDCRMSTSVVRKTNPLHWMPVVITSHSPINLQKEKLGLETQ
jgi:hypothetical protein